MSSYKTPSPESRIKREEFRSKIQSKMRSEQFSNLKAIALEIKEGTTNKQFHKNIKFKELIQKLDLNCQDMSAIQELKEIVEYEGFIISESKCKEMLLILMELMKRSQKETDIAMNNYSPATSQLYEILTLLICNARRYPKHGCYGCKLILDTLMKILKDTKIEKIRKQTLKLCNLLVCNPETRLYFLKNGFLSILSQKTFITSTILIEELLTKIFNFTQLELSPENISELLKLFTFKGSVIFTSLEICENYEVGSQENNSMENFYCFLKFFCQEEFTIYNEEIISETQFVELITVFLERLEKIDIQTYGWKWFYPAMIQFVTDIIGECKLDGSQNTIYTMLRNLKKMSIIHEEIFILYQLLEKDQEVTPPEEEERHKMLNEIKENFEEIICSFTRLLELCINKLSHSYVAFLKYQCVLQFHQMFISARPLTTEQFRILLKYGSNKITRACYGKLIQWYEATIEHQEIRIMCLKILSQATRNGDVKKEEFYRMGELYESRRIDFEKKYDELTGFIFAEIPSLELIQAKEEEIKAYLLEKLLEEKDKHKKTSTEHQKQNLTRKEHKNNTK